LPRFERHFTLDEANALIPRIRSIFAKVHQLVRDLALPSDVPLPPFGAQAHPPASADTPDPAANGHAGNGNGHGAANVVDIESVWKDLSRHEKMQLINGLLQAVIDDGVVIQDVERGLVDFPAWHGAEEILLCYELADGPQIVAWHDLTSGFAGRRPLDELFDEPA